MSLAATPVIETRLTPDSPAGSVHTKSEPTAPAPCGSAGRFHCSAPEARFRCQTIGTGNSMLDSVRTPPDSVNVTVAGGVGAAQVTCKEEKTAQATNIA